MDQPDGVNVLVGYGKFRRKKKRFPSREVAAASGRIIVHCRELSSCSCDVFFKRVVLSRLSRNPTTERTRNTILYLQPSQTARVDRSPVESASILLEKSRRYPHIDYLRGARI